MLDLHDPFMSLQLIKQLDVILQDFFQNNPLWMSDGLQFAHFILFSLAIVMVPRIEQNTDIVIGEPTRDESRVLCVDDGDIPIKLKGQIVDGLEDVTVGRVPQFLNLPVNAPVPRLVFHRTACSVVTETEKPIKGLPDDGNHVERLNVGTFEDSHFHQGVKVNVTRMAHDGVVGAHRVPPQLDPEPLFIACDLPANLSSSKLGPIPSG